MRFTGVCILMRAAPRLSNFYAALLGAPVEGSETFASLTTDGATPTCFSEEGMERMAPGVMTGAGCGAYTRERQVASAAVVDETHDQMLRQVTTTVKPPTTQPWGRRSACLRDPDGNLVNVYADLTPQ